MSTPSPLPAQTPPAKRVLFVDADENFRAAVNWYLQSKGYLVETAQDGEEALKKIQAVAADCATTFDLLITELHMPGLDGIGLVRVVRQAPIQIPIIVCSFVFTETIVAEMRRLSVNAMLLKTSMVEDLANVVESVTRSHA